MSTKDLQKLLSRVEKTTTLTRKGFGTMRDLIKLRKAYNKYCSKTQQQLGVIHNEDKS